MNLNILWFDYNIETTTQIFLNSYNLINVPTKIAMLNNLQKIFLHNNKLTSLPKELWMLSNLKVLYLANNYLTLISPEIGKLKNLKEIDLINNKLVELPAEIGTLVNIEHLYLFNNKLKKLPREILNILNKLDIDETSYDIDNLDENIEFIIFNSLNKEVTNLPVTLKEIWITKNINLSLIKIPFGCELNYF